MSHVYACDCRKCHNTAVQQIYSELYEHFAYWFGVQNCGTKIFTTLFINNLYTFYWQKIVPALLLVFFLRLDDVWHFEKKNTLRLRIQLKNDTRCEQRAIKVQFY